MTTEISVSKITAEDSDDGVDIVGDVSVDGIIKGELHVEQILTYSTIWAGYHDDPGTYTSDVNASRHLRSARGIFAPNTQLTVVYRVLHTALSTDGTTITITLGNVMSSGMGDALWVPVAGFTKVLTAFSASGLSALTWTLGWASWVGDESITADPDGIAVADDADGTELGWYQLTSDARGAATDGTTIRPLNTQNQMTLTATSTGANLDDLTQGTMDVYIVFYTLPLQLS